MVYKGPIFFFRFFFFFFFSFLRKNGSSSKKEKAKVYHRSVNMQHILQFLKNLASVHYSRHQAPSAGYQLHAVFVFPLVCPQKEGRCLLACIVLPNLPTNSWCSIFYIDCLFPQSFNSPKALHHLDIYTPTLPPNLEPRDP